ncbi:alpha/beta fold hydrolase [Clostridium vincentii]|uniref:Proline iminopeptidase n=1 Tax=Clostridium vincentii TaxID=52704 RepID=A0A2T0BF47_9CLOT|nr:alpha/beta hydrolase [Clostridium vincentii]PRR82515.1 Proline iminopeptidase [Clostridium vincentii]
MKKTKWGLFIEKGRMVIGSVVVCLFICTLVLYFESPGTIQPFLDENNEVIEESISEKIFININGVKQGMFIKGKSVKNPVLLFIHGGPGMPEYFLAEKYSKDLEEHFIVCYWEQRGVGLSYNTSVCNASITLKQLLNDTIQVTNYIRQRFNQDKIYLMGHSWGSFLGIQVSASNPELYHAYIGIGQVVNMIESEKLAYQYMIDFYKENNNLSMVSKLEKFPVMESEKVVYSFFASSLRDEAMHKAGIGTMRNMKSVITGIFFPVMQCQGYTLSEKINIWRGKANLNKNSNLSSEMLAIDLTSKIPKINIPVYFISGGYDYTVNYSLSKKYYESLDAPIKGFYTFKNSAHSPLFEEPEKFISIMTEDILNQTSNYSDD